MKMGRKPLSADKKAAIIEAYKSNPSVQGVAKSLGYWHGTVRKVVMESGLPALSNDSVADSIIRRMEANPEMFNKNFEQLSAVLGSSNVVGVLRNQEKYRSTVVEQSKTALLLALCALITEDKLKQASPSAIAAVVPVLAEIASGKYPLGKDYKDQVDPDKIIESIQICLKRVKSFNPVLAKDVGSMVNEIIDLPKSAYKELRQGGSDGNSNSSQDRQ